MRRDLRARSYRNANRNTNRNVDRTRALVLEASALDVKEVPEDVNIAENPVKLNLEEPLSAPESINPSGHAPGWQSREILDDKKSEEEFRGAAVEGILSFTLGESKEEVNPRGEDQDPVVLRRRLSIAETTDPKEDAPDWKARDAFDDEKPPMTWESFGGTPIEGIVISNEDDNSQEDDEEEKQEDDDPIALRGGRRTRLRRARKKRKRALIEIDHDG
jgi:hypothetical protein